MKSTISLFFLMFSSILSYGQRSDTPLVSGDSILSIMSLNDNKYLIQKSAILKYTPASNPTFSFLKANDFKVYNMADFIVYNRLNTTPLWIREQHPVPYYIKQQKILVERNKKN